MIEDGSSLERHVTKYSPSAFNIQSIHPDTYLGLQFSQSALPTVSERKTYGVYEVIAFL